MSFLPRKCPPRFHSWALAPGQWLEACFGAAVSQAAGVTTRKPTQGEDKPGPWCLDR